MELKEAIEMVSEACYHYDGELYENCNYSEAFDTVLEELNNLQKEKEEYRIGWCNEGKKCEKLLEELNNRIPIKDIEDLKEKIHWELDKNGITRGYQIIIDGYFNKLLNKE